MNTPVIKEDGWSLRLADSICCCLIFVWFFLVSVWFLAGLRLPPVELHPAFSCYPPDYGCFPNELHPVFSCYRQDCGCFPTELRLLPDRTASGLQLLSAGLRLLPVPFLFSFLVQCSLFVLRIKRLRCIRFPQGHPWGVWLPQPHCAPADFPGRTPHIPHSWPKNVPYCSKIRSS